MEVEPYGQNEEQNTSTQSSSKKKGRGPTTGKKYRTQEPKYIEWGDNGKPIGKWAKSYKAYVGDAARSKIDITIKSWDDVSQGLKEIIWEDVKVEYHIDDKMKAIVLRNIWERWKDFKTKLVSGWITKTRKLPDDHKEPYEFYDAITKEQWEEFKKYCETDEFKQSSEKARQNQKRNEHPHYLGQAGYIGKKAKWIMEGYNSSMTLPSGSFLDRSMDWVLARSKKGVDGHYIIPNEKTKIVAEKVNNWREKAIEGSWVPYRQDDVLSRALEKKEHPGRVRGIGGLVGIKDVFGEAKRNKDKCPSGVISTNDLHFITQEIEASQIFDSMVEQKVASILNKMGIKMPDDMGVDNTPSVGIRSSCQSAYVEKAQSTSKVQEMDPFADLQKPTKCRLAAIINSEIIVVGRGMVHPASRSGDNCHNQQLLPDHVKVGIDAVEPIYVEIPLPVPTQYLTTIGEAIGSFSQWPKNLVLLGDNNMATHVVSKDKGEECVAGVLNNNEKFVNTLSNEVAKRKAIVDEEILKTLTDECKYFHDLVVQVPTEDNVINAIHVKKDIFTCEEDFEIHVTMDEIVQFLSMKWLNASWLQIYILWLNHMCNDLELKAIGFMCPQKLSQVRKFPDATNTYISNTWSASKSKNLLLAPYYEGKHCILIVFRLEKSEVYVLDPQSERKHNLKIKPQANMAFKTYRVRGGKSRASILNWNNVKCPQQQGSMDCTYYVMRYMHDIIKNHRQIIELNENFIQVDSYSQQEMDEVRDNMASYIMQNLM